MMDDEDERIDWRSPVAGQPNWWLQYMEHMSAIMVQYGEDAGVEIGDFYANLYCKDSNNLVYPTKPFNYRDKANKRRQTQRRSKTRRQQWTVPSFPASLYKLFKQHDIIDRLYIAANGVEPPREEEIETPPTMATNRSPRTPPRVQFNDNDVNQLSEQFQQGAQLGSYTPPVDEFITKADKIQLTFGYQVLIAGLMIYLNEAGRVTDDGLGRKKTVCFEQTFYNWNDREEVSSMNLFMFEPTHFI